MKELLEKMEGFLKNIGEKELRKNSKASAKALEIKRKISDLKGYVQNPKPENQGVLQYISVRALLEN